VVCPIQISAKGSPRTIGVVTGAYFCLAETERPPRRGRTADKISGPDSWLPGPSFVTVSGLGGQDGEHKLLQAGTGNKTVIPRTTLDRRINEPCHGAEGIRPWQGESVPTASSNNWQMHRPRLRSPRFWGVPARRHGTTIAPRLYPNSMPNYLPPEGPIWNLIFWVVIGLLVAIAADAVLYGLAPKNALDLP